VVLPRDPKQGEDVVAPAPDRMQIEEAAAPPRDPQQGEPPPSGATM
jgi:hypothetical protein